MSTSASVRFRSLAHGVEFGPPPLVIRGWNEAHRLNTEQCVSVDAEKCARGGIGIDNLAVVGVECEKGVGDPVDRRDDDSSVAARGAP